MRRVGVLALAASCYRGAPAVRVDRAPELQVLARLAVASGDRVRIVRVTARDVVVERTVRVPAVVSAIVWASEDPVVLLDRQDENAEMGRVAYEAMHPDAPTPPPEDSRHQNELGRIAATGYVAFRPLTWPDPKPDEEPLAYPQVGLVAAGRAIWQGRCAHGFTADGGLHCSDGAWVYARRIPEPVVFATEAPETEAAPLLPELAVPAGIEVEEDAPVLRCTQHAVTVQIPAKLDEDSGFVGMSRPEWLASEPPIWRTAENSTGYAMRSEEQIYVGCKPAPYAHAIAGPHGVAALVGARLAIVWHGHVIGELPGGARLAFAP